MHKPPGSLPMPHSFHTPRTSHPLHISRSRPISRTAHASPIPRLLLLLCAAAPMFFAAPAHAACGPTETDFSVPSPLPAVPVTLALDDERVLLGKRGERVPTNGRLAWIDDSGDLMPHTWADKVDWSAYRAGNKVAGSAPTRLYFDADRRLCRIERYRPIRGKAVLDGGFTLAYDATGALKAYTEYGEAGASGDQPYQPTRRACVQRDAQGRLTAFIDDGCSLGSAGSTASATTGTAAGASRHYVRDASGGLLRVIDLASPGQPVAVQTLDAQGKPGPRYVLQSLGDFAPGGDTLAAYAAPPGKPSDRLFPVHRDALAALPVDVPDNPWRVVRIKDDVPLDDDMLSWDPDAQTVLAEGAQSTPGGAILTPAQQQAVWQAMGEHPWRVYFYRDPASRVMLLPAMPPEKWKACSDPANPAPDACAS